MKLSIKSVLGTAPMTTQQPVEYEKVLMAEFYGIRIMLSKSRRLWDFLFYGNKFLGENYVKNCNKRVC